MERFTTTKYGLCGTVDEVKADMEDLHRIHGDGELEWFTLLLDQGLMPLDEVKEQLATFAEHIMPEFKETSAPRAPATAA